MSVVVHGYRYSVYHWIVCMCLSEQGIRFTTTNVNPFENNDAGQNPNIHPFNRVPTLVHDGFIVYETAAITRYIANGFAGKPLVPTDTRRAARMDQVISISDNYAYWPMIRQVFSQRVFHPLEGLSSDENEIERGLVDAKHTLSVLEQIASEGFILDGLKTTLADIHLAPMIGYFIKAPEGQNMMEQFPVLLNWWRTIANLNSYCATQPNLSKNQ